MPFEKSATRVWKKLGRDEKLAAARHFWAQPPDEALAAAQSALMRVLHVRPQSLHKLPPEQRVRALASVLDPGELLAASLLVALHLGERRPLLVAFLEAAGVPHDQGLIAEDAFSGPASADQARRGLAAIMPAFPRSQVLAYLNTLWLQDHDRWEVLERIAEEAAG